MSQVLAKVLQLSSMSALLAYFQSWHDGVPEIFQMHFTVASSSVGCSRGEGQEQRRGKSRRGRIERVMFTNMCLVRLSPWST